MKKSLPVFLAFVIVLLLTQASTVFAASITVNTNGDTAVGGDGLCDLREAIRNAETDADTTGGDCTAGAGADTITFDSGYTIVLGSTLPAIDTDVTVDGTGGVTISGGNAVRLFVVNTGGVLSLQNLTLDSGFINTGTNDGAAVSVSAGGTLNTNTVTFSNNVAADDGGAIRTDGTSTIVNSIFNSNQGTDLGGAIFQNGGTTSVTGSTFNGNQSATAGAILTNSGDLTISNSSFTGNFSTSAAGDGGALVLGGGGTHTITGSNFNNNYAEDNGGALSIATGILTITDTTFQNHNNAVIDAGGALYISGGTININGGTFSNNQATQGGGAIRVAASGAVTISGTTFSSNSADDGGAVSYAATNLITITDATFSNNQAVGATAVPDLNGDGGALFLVGNSAAISGNTFSGNTAADDGGAVYLGAPTSITGSVFSGNTANGGDGDANGGAIFLAEAATASSVTLSSFLNNTATVGDAFSSLGGAISNSTDNLVIANATFSGNAANKSVGGAGTVAGGALFTAGTAANPDSVSVYNSTFSGNSITEAGGTAGDGGNISNDIDSTTSLVNTIVANGSAGGVPNNCGGPITDNGNNIDFNGGDNCGAGFDNSDPELMALTGSPAYFPIALTLTNPALDAGDNTVCAGAPVNNQSQNGETRPVDGDNSGTAECDIGSYEAPADTTPPSVTINQAAGQADPTNTSPILFTVVFSETVTGFATGDVALSGTAGATTGTVTEIAPNDGTTYEVSVSGMTTDGTVIANVPASVAVDAIGNGNNASTSTDNTVTYDTGGPTVTINQSAGQADPTNTSPILFTVVFSESVTGFATGDVTLSGSAGATTDAVTEVAPNDGTTYEVAVSGMATDGTVIADIAAGVAIDGAGNSNSASTSTDNIVTYDVTAPSVTINQASGQADPTNTSPINFTVVFSEPVTGFANGDATLSGTAGATTDTVTEIAPNDGTTYNVAVSGMATNGTVIADIAAGVAADAAGNPNAASTSTDNTVTYDAAGPSVTINQAAGQSDPTNTSPINFTVVFSEPVTGFATGDVTLSGTAGATTGTVTEIAPNDGTTYNVAVSGMAANGTVVADIAAGVAVDTSGNDNLASTSTDNTVTYDTDGPTVTIDQAAGQTDPTNTSPIVFTVVFSEPVTGFAPGDVTLSGTAGATTDAVTEVAPNDGTTYEVAVSGMATDGTVIAALAAGVATDTSGNDNLASTSTDNSVTYDTTAPTPVISGPASPTTNDPFTITINFGEEVVGFEAADILVTNGIVVLPLMDEGGGVFTVEIAAASFGVVLVDIAANAAQDLAGNSSLAAEQFSIEVIRSETPGEEAVLPKTGFPQGVVTALPAQPDAAAYQETSILLKVPSLGLSLPIVGVPLNDQGWDVTWLNRSVGYLEGSAFPTWPGNTVLTGHVWDANNQPGPFVNVKDLKYGDRIEIEAWGMTYIYEVRESDLVTPGDVRTVFQHEQYDWITLVTCEDYQFFFENYSFRRVVRAVLVEVK